MLKFIQFTTTRAFLSLFTLLAVSLIVFSLMELVPANCAERYLAFKNTQGQNITIEDIAAEEKRLGLDKPFPVRWGNCPALTPFISATVAAGHPAQVVFAADSSRVEAATTPIPTKVFLIFE